MERRTASPARFYPTGLDCRSWARAARQGGINCAIPAAKRRDGFCLWPTRAAEYSVKSNPWKRRTVRELQPGAVAAQTGDPDIRWGGNEAGCVHPDPRTVVDEERWATAWEIEPTRLRKGGAYLPVEMDTTINRAGWFWHPGSEEKINYLDQHLGVYLQGMRKGGSPGGTRLNRVAELSRCGVKTPQPRHAAGNPPTAGRRERAVCRIDPNPREAWQCSDCSGN